jgi:hypothetical protein
VPGIAIGGACLRTIDHGLRSADLAGAFFVQSQTIDFMAQSHYAG